MKLKYFSLHDTEEILKARYRALAKKYHPDLGGDKKIMQQINQEYIYVRNHLKEKPQQKEAQQHKSETDDLLEAFLKEFSIGVVINLYTGEIHTTIERKKKSP